MSYLKKTTTGLLVPIAMICASCSTATSLIPSSIPAVGHGFLSVTLADEKAYYAFSAGYFGVLVLVDKGVDAGLIKGQLAQDIKAKILLVREYRRLAKSALDAGNATQLKAQVEAGLALVGGLQEQLSGLGLTPPQ